MQTPYFVKKKMSLFEVTFTQLLIVALAMHGSIFLPHSEHVRPLKLYAMAHLRNRTARKMDYKEAKRA